MTKKFSLMNSGARRSPLRLVVLMCHWSYYYGHLDLHNVLHSSIWLSGVSLGVSLGFQRADSTAPEIT